MIMRSGLVAGGALAAAALLFSACGVAPHADVVALDWPAAKPTLGTVADRIGHDRPIAPPPSVPVPTSPSVPVPTSPSVPVPTSSPVPSLSPAPSAVAPSRTTTGNRLSWVCRTDGSAASDVRRHRAFVRNIAVSGLPAVSQQQVLAQLPIIERNLPLYCATERATAVPALVLAAIHYREANNDPTRSIMSGEPLGAINPDTHVVEGTTSLDNALNAADHLVRGAAEIYGVRVDGRMNAVDLAYAVAAYNRGGRYCRADQMHPMRSPYVAAGLIDGNVGMIWPDLGSDDGGPESWGEPPSVRGRPDHRLGVLAVLRGLGSEITAPAFSWDTDEVVIPCR